MGEGQAFVMGICTSRNSDPLPQELRFRERERVQVKVAPLPHAWMDATVVGLRIRRPTDPKDSKPAAYQVKVDDLTEDEGGFAFVSQDSDEYIKAGTEVSQMGVKGLRLFITSAGLSATDCIEKSELVAQAKEATKRVVLNAKNWNARAPKEPFERKFSGLNCVCVEGQGKRRKEAAGKYDLVFICLHGLGACPTNFLPLKQMMESLPYDILWVLPYAPAPLVPIPGINPPVWFKVDFIKIAMETRKGEEGMARLLRDKPGGLDQCREQLQGLVSEVCAYAKVGPEKVIFGGFSLGSMAAMDAVLSRRISDPKKEVGGVVMMSGAPIVVEKWHKLLKNHRGLRVLITHGRQDSTLPYAASNWCRDLLTRGGADVRHVSHDGGHEMGPPHVLQELASFISATNEHATRRMVAEEDDRKSLGFGQREGGDEAAQADKGDMLSGGGASG